MVVPPPGLFSITIGWPRRAESLSPTARATMSTPPPGGKGTTNLIARVGRPAPARPPQRKGARCRARCASLDLDASLLHHLRPQRVLARDQRIQLLGLAANGDAALRHQAFLHLRRRD